LTFKTIRVQYTHRQVKTLLSGGEFDIRDVKPQWCRTAQKVWAGCRARLESITDLVV
jgi:hypothetical protein